MTHDEIVADFPELTEAHIRATLEFAAVRERRLATSRVRLLFDQKPVTPPRPGVGAGDLPQLDAHDPEPGYDVARFARAVGEPSSSMDRWRSSAESHPWGMMIR